MGQLSVEPIRADCKTSQICQVCVFGGVAGYYAFFVDGVSVG